MAFLDKLGDLARNIGDKTSETIETTKINNRIGSEKTAIAECMRRLGEIYYRRHQEGDSGDPAAAEILATIDAHNKAIADAQAEIERIKAKAAAQAAPPAPPANATAGAVCPSCGKANPAATKFCQECGAKIEAPPPAASANIEAPAPAPAPSADIKAPAAVPAPSADGAVCPSCGKANPAATKFCQECGAKIEAPPPPAASTEAPPPPAPPAERACPACGATVPAANIFCGGCGHRMD
jgi:membrane protease subunit (stomatin/prohibitin family)